MLKIILLGPPGSGKGTQAELLCKNFKLKHISTGELLRKAIISGNDLGLKAKILINSGKLVSDKIMISVVKESLETTMGSNLYNGFVLDGFPRNIVQAQALKLDSVIDWVIYFNVEDQVIINRLAGRRYHPSSGRIYHLKHNPPKNLGFDDITNEPLIIREDDQENVVKKRLLIYHKKTEKLIEWYKTKHINKLIQIDATNDQSEIFQKILNSIKIV